MNEMDGKQTNEYPTFDEQIFNKKIADSSTFDIITNLETNEKRFETIIDNCKINNKFVEMPLQLTPNLKNKIRQPILMVEDRGYKNENFRNYEIILIDEKNEKKIKCYRRFSNFDSLNQKLREKYPYIIIPSLPKKNYKVKLINLKEEFYSNRTRHLKSYINYIFKHEILKNSIHFAKFLNDAQFVKYKE